MIHKLLIDLKKIWLGTALCWLSLCTVPKAITQDLPVWSAAPVEIGRNDGLEEPVFGILQDSSGYIWFGTNSSLIRFGGIEFKRFRFGGSVLLPAMDHNGHIWFLGHPRGDIFGFNGRVFTRHPDNLELFNLPSAKNSRFHAFALDSNGMLLTTRTDMLHSNKNGITSYTNQLLQTQPIGTHYLLRHGNQHLMIHKRPNKPAEKDSVTFRDNNRIVLNLASPLPAKHFARTLKNGSVLMLSKRSVIIVQPDNSIVRRTMPERGTYSQST